MRALLAAAATAVAALYLCACPTPPPLDPDPGRSSVAVDRAAGIVADGTDPVVITVTVRDTGGKPVSGQEVTLTVTGQQNQVSQPTRTNGDGVSTATLTTRVAEIKTITARIAQGELFDQPTATFVAGPPSAMKSMVTVNPASAAADGLAAVAIQVVVRDAYDNQVRGAQVALSLSGSGNTLVQPAATDVVGATSGSASSTRAETKRVTAVVTPAGGSGVTLLQQPLIQFVSGPAARLAFTVPPSNAAIGDPITPAIEVAVQDANGNLVASSGAQVSLAFGTRPATGAILNGTLTRQAQGGLATFNDISTDKAGSGATLVASSTGLASATSSAFTVTPGAGPRLSFQTQPQDVASGASLGLIQVALQDANGNTIITATDPVSVALTGAGGAVLSGTTTVAASSGVATFSDLSIARAGTGYTLVVTCAGYTGAASRTFTIAPGAPNRLAFQTQPASTVAGAAMAPALQVAVQDAAGNVVTADTRTVTIGIGSNPGGGTLSGTTAAGASAGVAVFNNLSINKVGAGYTLVASAAGLTSAVSNPFPITPGPASRLAFTSQPGTSTAGAPLAPPVQVTVQDQFGNTATGSTASITVALDFNPTGAPLMGTLTVPATAGVAQFIDLSIPLAGTGYTLSAAATGFPRAFSTPFAVVAAAADRLAFISQPQSGAPDLPLAPAVKVAIQDAFGNVVTGDTRNVTVALQGGTAGAVLSGTTTVAAASGVATYADLSVNLGGSGYQLTASAGGVTGAQSTGFDITASSVTCQQTIHHVTRTGVIDQPGNLASDPIGAYVQSPDGGYAYYPGTGGLGTCVIPGVPQGRYLFRHGSSYVDTTARSIDLSYAYQGRQGQVVADAGTIMQATLTNLFPVNNRDRLLAHSFDSTSHVLGNPLPPPGSTSSTADYYWDGWMLPDATRGDILSVTQLSARNPPEYPMADGGIGPRFYRGATRVYSGGVTLQDGTTTAVDGGMVAVTQTTTTLGWRLTNFEAFRSQVHPSAALTSQLAFYMGPLVDSSRGFYGTTPRIVWIAWPWNPGDNVPALTMTYGNPFPYEPIARTYATFEVRQNVPWTDGGVDDALYEYADIALRDRVSTFPLSGMQPAVSPVSNPLINGGSFFATRSGMGAAPVVSWSPPAAGTATYYRLEVGELVTDPGGFTYSNYVATVDTVLTQVRLPPVLTPGKHYVIRLTAHYSPGQATETRPYELRWPAHYATSVSGIIAP